MLLFSPPRWNKILAIPYKIIWCSRVRFLELKVLTSEAPSDVEWSLIHSKELTSGIFVLISKLVVTRQGEISNPSSKKAMARIWYVRNKEATLVVWGMKREEMKWADSKARGGGKEEPRREKNVMTGWRKFFMPSLLNFLCMLVCVGTWVLI